MRLTVVMVFAAGICVTACACLLTVREQDRRSAAAFERDAGRIARDANIRLQTYFETLLSIRGLLATSTHLSDTGGRTGVPSIRADLAGFIAALQLQQRYPGFQSIQFVRPVADNDLSAFAETVRRDTSISAGGYPQFAIHPAGYAPIHYIVDFVDTVKGNEQAFGLDLTVLSPSLLQTLELARDSGDVVASERLRLMQDRVGKHEQPGFAARVAIYRRGLPVATVAGRRAALAGFVGIVFRVEELMAEVIDGATRDAMAVRIEDEGLARPGTTQREATSVMYDSAGGDPGRHRTLLPHLTARCALDVGQRRWNMIFSGYDGGPYSRDDDAVGLVALAGIVVSALAAALAGNAWRPRPAAGDTIGEAVADEMTGEPAAGEAIGAPAADDEARRRAEAALADTRRELEHRTTELIEQKAVTDAAHDDLSGVMSTLKHAQSCLAASEKMATLGTLVAGVAHELNTPIGNSLLTATALQDMAREFELQMVDGAVRRSALEAHLAETRQACGILATSLTRAAELIASFKQVAVDQASGQCRRFELADVLRDTLATYRAQLRRVRCEVRFDMPAGLIMESYPGSVVQVIGNLLGNALLHGFDGAGKGMIDIAAQADGDDWVVLVFRDNGAGMAAQTLHRVFDPFFTTKMGRGGSGLGMHIVYNIVTGVLGGSIAIESAPGHGTSIRLTLPRKVPLQLADCNASLAAPMS
jgi:signal transduction histidine kinase/CHASE1-domain containing sensor protein